MQPEGKMQTDLCDRVRLILLDDNEHTFNYVIDMLKEAFGMSEEQAIEHAMQVDAIGRTILIVGTQEEAARAWDLIIKHGADPSLARSKGPMAVIIEPAIIEPSA